MALNASSPVGVVGDQNGTMRVLTSGRGVRLAVAGLVLGAVSVGGVAFGQGDAARYAPIVPRSAVRFIPVPRGASVDEPIWLGSQRIQVSYFDGTIGSLARINKSRSRFVDVQSLQMPGCGQTGADRETRRTDGEIVYRTTCFRPDPSLPLTLPNLLGFALMDLRTGASRRLAALQPTYVTGSLSFSPNGRRGVASTGGPSSRLEWVSAMGLTVFQQGLAIAEGPTWSPDGLLIAFDGTSSEAAATMNLYTFRPDQPSKLHRFASGLANVEPGESAWMPHSSRWLMANVQPLHQPAGLWIFDVATGRKALVIEGRNLGRPAVSPDGKTLAIGVGIDARWRRPASSPA